MHASRDEHLTVSGIYSEVSRKMLHELILLAYAKFSYCKSDLTNLDMSEVRCCRYTEHNI